ncbi:MAG: sodium:proton antiporter [Rhodoglobus sp.]
MQFALCGVVAIATIVAAGLFGRKLGVAAPLILIVIGVGYSFIPGAPVEINHEWILLGLLPPILYSAALNVPVIEFRRNFTSISALSVVLVVATAFGTAAVLLLVFPGLSFASAVAIGAVISPTDAVAATAIGKRLGLPPRLVSILEGEGLVNDATALVLLRSALAATAAAVSFWGVVGDFAYAVALALVIGFVVGSVTVFLRSKLSDPVLDTAISFAVPFIAFIPAEAAHASGVLAVVVAGLYSGHNGVRKFSPQARISERLNWRTVQYLLENGVFLIMGLELSKIVANVQKSDLSADRAVYIGLLLALAVIVLRFVFVWPLLWLLRRQKDRAEVSQGRFALMLERLRHAIDLNDDSRRGVALVKRQANAEKFVSRRQADLDSLKNESLGWRGGIVLGWSGMRGVVTVAAAQSLPEGTPFRVQLVLIAFTVAIVTLLLQGGTLPWVIRATGIPGADLTADRTELAELLDEIGEAGLAVLENPQLELPDGQAIDQDAVERVRHDTLLSAESAWERANHGGGDGGLEHSPQKQYRALRREVLAAQREALLEARSEGAYPSRILARAQTMLDLEETRLAQIDNPGGT